MKYQIDKIDGVVRSLETPRRYMHTLGVQNEAYKLGMIFAPEKAEKLSVAGLLHDITKDISLEEQLKMCDEFKINTDRNAIVPKLLHAKTGCEFARKIFGMEVVDDEIYSGIFYHTTGRENMTLFETIIYLADYIEEGRTFEDCVKLREFFYEGLKKATNHEEKIEVLRKTMVLSFDLTIKGLIDEGKVIDFDTVKARNYFLCNREVFR